MREDAVKEFLVKANSGWQLIEELLNARKLVELDYEGNRFLHAKNDQKE
jgi:hypothetical protein